MKVFITGASGFIGKRLLAKLLKEGYSVTALVRSEEQANKIKKTGAKTIIGDLTSPGTFVEELNQHDAVIHLAAIRANWGDSKKFYAVNSQAFQNFFQPKTKIKHIIATSSVYVLGNLMKLPAEETDPLLATDLYGKSKIAAEKIVKETAEKFKIPYTIIRPAIVYGPHDNELGMVVKLIGLIKKNSLPIIGDGKNVIHLVYVDDLVNGYLKALKKGGTNQTYILAGEKPIRVLDLIEMIKKELHISYKNKYFPKPIMYTAAIGVETLFKILTTILPNIPIKEPPLSRQKIDTLFGNWHYSIQKAKKELGYKPAIDYKEGIRKTIDGDN